MRKLIELNNKLEKLFGKPKVAAVLMIIVIIYFWGLALIFYALNPFLLTLID